ncbi:choice-of-anchor P family protein [Nocardioides sp.]|uniref:choice-of-anchor P family protein n=1 Tax=Nocardioides sp. TaxID=35761 RepID=UPI0027240B9E|nr:choice-of-anchor P family protein [Nocardioides sp.]MDO9454674.1 choice-of-anchor P family protein [Nocardioides sp.]
MRRVLPVAVAAAALCLSQLPASTALVPPGGVSSASVKAAATPKIRTKYAFSGSAYGSRVEGGSLPANSRDTAFQRIGCTNIAGDNRRNYEADLVIPGLGKVEGVTSRVYTEKRGSTVSVVSQHSIARLVIASSPLGSLEVRGISSTSTAFNKNGRYGTTVDNEVARIVLKLTGVPAQTLAIPAPGRTLTVPGLASISLGKTNKKVTRDYARISANVLDVKVIPLGTRVRVAQTNAAIQGGIRQGIFKGYSAGIEARGLADNLKVGRTPLSVVPCRGTQGKDVGKDITGVDLGDLGNLRGVASGVKTTNQPRVATGTVAGRVAQVSLLGGRIQVNGVLGVANVKRQRGVLTRNSKGSTVLEIIIDGKKYSLAALAKIEIPGLVKLQDKIEVRTAFGLKVIGLRITLLDGTGAVLDLGVAELGIRPGVPAGQ